ncbi:MAG: hypothetical protein D6674_07625 [Acidobacteria bacterium]|jgi:hypothetical protein|nr:MAG: hypothetical protein D6674_07625 [Acidobacteriota bacterium]
MRISSIALVGVILLPLGGLSYTLGLIGGLVLAMGVRGLLKEEGLKYLEKPFYLGLTLAILGGFWARHVLLEEGFDHLRLLLTSLVSGTGLYIQSLCYSALARIRNMEHLELGGIMLVIGAFTFVFYVGFIPLAIGVLLLAYSFWRW